MAAHWFESVLLDDGWARRVRLTVNDGRIAAIDQGVDPNPSDERVAVGLPGLPNVHSHAFQRGMAGLAEGSRSTPDSFWGWRELMYRFVERMTPDDIEAIAAMAYVEMLESGFTRVGEFHYLHHDESGRAYGNVGETCERIAAAAMETGLRLTLLPVFYAHSDFGGSPPAAGQKRFASSVSQFGQILMAAEMAVRSTDLGVLGVAPHSLRAVTPEELTWIVAACADGPIHIHIAEQMREVETCLAWSGQRPLEWLFNNAPVDERWCLVHATHALPQETAAIVARRAVVGLCPVTEANLGDGLFAAQSFLKQGGVIGIGSDSNVLIDAAEELRLLEYGQRLACQTRNVLAGPDRSTGRSLFEAALVGGGQALGVSSSLGLGAPADFFSLDLAHPSLSGRSEDALLDSWIFACRRPAIADVWIGGRKVVRAGAHGQRMPIEARYKKTLARILR